MNTFITGGTGFLGSYLVGELSRRGHFVRVLVRKNSNCTGITGPNFDLYQGDLSDEDHLFNGCKGFDFVIHAAAQTPGKSDKFSDYAESNIRGTRNIIKAAERAGVRRIVYVSSCCVFGGGTKDRPGTELSEFNGYRFGSGYINSKYLAHQWILSEIEKRKLPVVIVSPTVLIGAYPFGNSMVEAIKKMIHQKIRFYTKGGKNFIDVRDAATATCNALTMGIIGESYLLAAENLTYLELIERLKKYCNLKGLNIGIPTCLLSFFGILGSLIGALLGKYCKLNFTNTTQLNCESYFIGAKAVRDLRLPKHSINDAIYEMIGQLNDNANLSESSYCSNELSPTVY